MSELACYTYSLVSVPLYDTLGTEAIEYIIDKGELLTGKDLYYKRHCDVKLQTVFTCQ